MADATIQLGEWRPDRAPHMSPDLSEAVNVLSVAGGYAPMPSLVPVTGTHLGFRAEGFFSVPSASGDPIVYTATGQRVYRIRNGSFDEAYYAGDISDASWWFAQIAGDCDCRKGHWNRVPAQGHHPDHARRNDGV
jgi:hypothetical protein